MLIVEATSGMKPENAQFEHLPVRLCETISACTVQLGFHAREKYIVSTYFNGALLGSGFSGSMVSRSQSAGTKASRVSACTG